MVHVSNYGFFGEKLKPFTDLNGYIPEEGDKPEDGTWADRFTPTEWKEFLAKATAAKEKATTALDEWRDKRVGQIHEE